MSVREALLEPVPVMDTFATGLARVEKLGGDCFRFYLYVIQGDEEGGQEKVVVAKIILHRSSVPDAIIMTLMAMGASLASPILSVIGTTPGMLPS